MADVQKVNYTRVSIIIVILRSRYRKTSDWYCVLSRSVIWLWMNPTPAVLKSLLERFSIVSWKACINGVVFVSLVLHFSPTNVCKPADESSYWQYYCMYSTIYLSFYDGDIPSITTLFKRTKFRNDQNELLKTRLFPPRIFCVII